MRPDASNSRSGHQTRPTSDLEPHPSTSSPFLQNRRNTSARLELMKYNRYMRKHTLHRELKK